MADFDELDELEEVTDDEDNLDELVDVPFTDKSKKVKPNLDAVFGKGSEHRESNKDKLDKLMTAVTVTDCKHEYRLTGYGKYRCIGCGQHKLTEPQKKFIYHLWRTFSGNLSTTDQNKIVNLSIEEASQLINKLKPGGAV